MPCTYIRARNNGRSTDNVRTDCGFDWSNFRLAGHVDWSKFNRIENEINLMFLLFSCFSCYLSSCCVLRLIKLIFISPLYFTFIVKHFKVL